MNKFLQIVLCTSSFFQVIHSGAMNNTAKFSSLEQLSSAVLGSHIIRERIPGNQNLLSNAFKKFLSKPHHQEILPSKNDVACIAFRQDGTHVLNALEDNSVHIWNILTGKLVCIFHHDEKIRTVDFSPDGTAILSILADGRALLWNITENKFILTLDGISLTEIDFSPCGTIVTVIKRYKKNITLLNAKNGTLIQNFLNVDNSSSVVFSPDSTKILTGNSMSSVRVWNISDGRLVHVFADLGPISKKSFSPDGNHVLIEYPDDAKLWSMQTGTIVHTFQPAGDIFNAILSPDGTRVLILTYRKFAKLVNALTGNLIYDFEHDQKAEGGLFNPEGTQICTWEGNVARLWDVANGNLIQTFPHNYRLGCALFSSDGSKIFTISHYHAYDLWDILTGTLEHSCKTDKYIHTFMFVGTANNQILVQDGEQISLWSIPEGEILEEFFARINLNQLELLQAFELAMRERSRIHINSDITGEQIMEIFKSFPTIVQKKLQHFIVKEEKPILAE